VPLSSIDDVRFLGGGFLGDGFFKLLRSFLDFKGILGYDDDYISISFRICGSVYRVHVILFRGSYAVGAI